MSITDHNEQVIEFSYTGDVVTTITDPADRETVLTYDSGHLVSITDPDEAVSSFDYDGDLLTTFTNPREYEWAFVYNDAGRIGQVNRPDDTEEALVAWQMQGLAGPLEGTAMNHR